MLFRQFFQRNCHRITWISHANTICNLPSCSFKERAIIINAIFIWPALAPLVENTTNGMTYHNTDCRRMGDGIWYGDMKIYIKMISRCIMMTSSNGNIFRVTGPLCGEFTGPGEFPAQRPVTRSFDLFFHLRLNKRLSKHSWGWWFETPACLLWRHRNV